MRNADRQNDKIITKQPFVECHYSRSKPTVTVCMRHRAVRVDQILKGLGDDAINYIEIKSDDI